MIEFKNVSKVYANGTHALNNININIDKGEFVFIVGASGAGKSTFLKLLMREEVPTSGSIKIKDYNLSSMKKRQIPYFRRNMGIVFQDFRLIPNMNVYDNVAFAMRVVGSREKEIRKRVPYVISIVGLSAKARCMPNELSGGEQQRVALARALANNADIIIADEPTGNVDPQMSYEIVELLMRLNETGTTVIMVTHAHELVTQFDKRVIVIEKGELVSDGFIENTNNIESSTAHLNDLAKQRYEIIAEGFSATGENIVKAPKAADKNAPSLSSTPKQNSNAGSKDESATAVDEKIEKNKTDKEKISADSSEESVDKNEKVSDDFLDALLGDNESYKIYLQGDSEDKKDGDNQ